MRLRSTWLACAALVSVSACETAPASLPAPSQEAKTPWLSSQLAASGRFILPSTLALPLATGHSLAADCASDPTLSACVVISGQQGRMDPDAVRAGYVTVLESQGWQMQWSKDADAALLRTATGPQRCLQISFGVWDDGKTARIRLKPVLRFELDPYLVNCANPGDGPTVLPVMYPGARG